MDAIQMFLQEMEQEAQTTRKMLERVPNDEYDWQPHKKSMNIKTLATHIADLPSWVTMALTTEELDFAVTPYQPEDISNTTDLLSYFEKNYTDGMKHLAATNEAQLALPWTLRNGDEIYMKMNKGEVIRHAISQTIHHRAQLGVYLRLLDIPIPGSYGPSADEQGL